jgi:bifunctional DNA primase/polymerase-like protein
MIKAAREYIKRGWAPVPIPDGSKSPILDDWQDLTITLENVSRFFNSGPQNIGVQLGPKSKGLADVDLDCSEAVALAPHFLPETGAIFGRKSKPKSHYLYYTSDPEPKATIKLKCEKQETIIELRLGAGGKGAQTVFPTSRHESGEHVTWIKSGEPSTVSFAALNSAVKKIAVASLLVRHWPGKGGRHDAALRAGGFLARAGWDPDAIEYFVESVAYAADDDEVEDRRKTAADAAAAFGRGEQVFGLPALAVFRGKCSKTDCKNS